jgi:hypothetical protein
MRLTEAWNGLMKENSSLKIAVFFTSSTALVMACLAFMFSQNNAIVIDRSPISKVAEVAGSEPTKEELQSFIKETLAQRFNTEAKELNYLSDLQKLAREKEQEELAHNQMEQFIYVESIKEEKSAILIESTRLIFVGEIRSALRFPLQVKLEKVGRTPLNPYGLILTEVQTLKPEAKE